MERIAIAMSGGVDSSVAAYLLKEQGHEVVGVSMRLFVCNRLGKQSCCTEEDRRDARAVCEMLGIKHRSVDMTEIFRKAVIDPFLDDYLNGLTPSPCILCNEHLKFRALLDEARGMGFEKLATGHYARIVQNSDTSFSLLRAVEPAKDQSYFLFPALSGAVNDLLFPVGHLTKGEVRRIAKEQKLPVHDKRESQEVCFVPGDDYAAFIEEARPEGLPGRGRFVDVNGNDLGAHSGIHNYTVGQRRGLGIGFGARKYVVRIDAEKNEVVLGDDEDLCTREMVVRDVVWAAFYSPAGRADVKIRSRSDARPASFQVEGSGLVRVKFDEAQRAITPGQAAVFYVGDEVVGGGWITGY